MTAQAVPETDSPPPTQHRSVGEIIARYAAPIALVALFVIFFIATPKFLTTSNMTALFISAAILVVLAMGQQLVITVAGIDLSVGSNLPWAATIIGWTSSHGWGTPASIVAGILAGLAVGIVNGILVARLKMTDFIVTLGSLSVVSGLTLLVTSGNQIAVSSGFLQGLALNGIGPIRWFWLVGLVVAALTAYVLFWTRTGTYLLSTGGNLEAARDVGIPVNRVRLLAYAGSGLACGIAGVLFVSNNGGSDPTMQTNLLLSSIAAVVLGGSSLSGGRASVLGATAGAVLLQTLLNGFTLLNISQYYQPIAVGIVVLGAAFLSRFQR
jgi:ribose transport system permease protein